MATHVIGKTLDVGEALRSYVEKRVVHTGEKFLATSARTPWCASRRSTGSFEPTALLMGARQPSQRAKNKKARKRR
jgi:hypothetical protein